MIQEKTKGIYTLRFFGNVNLSVKTIFLFLSTFGHEQLMSDFFLPTNKALSWARKKSVSLRPKGSHDIENSLTEFSKDT